MAVKPKKPAAKSSTAAKKKAPVKNQVLKIDAGPHAKPTAAAPGRDLKPKPTSAERPK